MEETPALLEAVVLAVPKFIDPYVVDEVFAPNPDGIIHSPAVSAKNTSPHPPVVAVGEPEDTWFNAYVSPATPVIVLDVSLPVVAPSAMVVVIAASAPFSLIVNV